MGLSQHEVAQLPLGARVRPSEEPPVPKATRRRIQALVLFTFILTGCFIRPLYDLMRFALQSDLYSHILLVPFISFYLIWVKRRNLAFGSRPCRRLAILPLAVGAGILAVYYLLRHSGWRPHWEDYLAVMTLALLAFLWSGIFSLLGPATVRVIGFPLSFLIFIVPFPDFLLQRLQTFLQVGSAAVAHLLFQVSGTPVLQQGMVFQLPGFSLEVATQCSGIHSSLVLFLTSLVAAHLLLRSSWTKALLVLFVIPLAMIRNGVRIFTIGQLCVQVGPDMIHSYVHTHGGPIFFALSLAPFFLLLVLLIRLESKHKRTDPVKPGS